MQERVAIPDFLHVRHFLANDGGPRRYLALHVTATLDVFRSDPYRAAFTSQTDWSLSNFARMRDTQRRVGELVLDIIQGKTAVVEASRAYDLSPSKVEDWVEDGKRGMENVLRANPLDLKERYERQIEELHETWPERPMNATGQHRAFSVKAIGISLRIYEVRGTVSTRAFRAQR